jgi:hypothetical protein
MRVFNTNQREQISYGLTIIALAVSRRLYAGCHWYVVHLLLLEHGWCCWVGLEYRCFCTALQAAWLAITAVEGRWL